MLKPRIFEAGSVIVAAGDEVNDVYLLRFGSICVEVPLPFEMDSKKRRALLKGQTNDSIYLDWLNEGSCFCIYSAFT